MARERSRCQALTGRSKRHGRCWAEPSFPTQVIVPPEKVLDGYDVVSFHAGTSAECSPLSCDGLATEVETNSHCLLATLELHPAVVYGGPKRRFRVLPGRPLDHRSSSRSKRDRPACGTRPLRLPSSVRVIPLHARDGRRSPVSIFLRSRVSPRSTERRAASVKRDWRSRSQPDGSMPFGAVRSSVMPVSTVRSDYSHPVNLGNDWGQVLGTRVGSLGASQGRSRTSPTGSAKPHSH
jgi:hypothetical protein